MSQKVLIEEFLIRRLTAEEALSHPYVAQFHSAADEPSAAGPVSISVDDNVKVQGLRVLGFS